MEPPVEEIEAALKQEQKKRRKVVLESIATHGLDTKRGKEASAVSSIDAFRESKRTRVSGVVVFDESRHQTEDTPYKPEHVEKAKDPWDQWLYYGASSVLPVIAERSSKREKLGLLEEKPQDTLEDRFASSVVVVAPADNLSFSSAVFPEASSQEALPSENFSTVLAPDHLLSEVENAFSDAEVEIIPVGTTTKEVFTERNVPRFGNPAKGTREFGVPDYESALRDLVAQSDKPLFVHGVRLPTIEDVEADM